jgi:hypothetical protein
LGHDLPPKGRQCIALFRSQFTWLAVYHA